MNLWWMKNVSFFICEKLLWGVLGQVVHPIVQSFLKVATTRDLLFFELISHLLANVHTINASHT